MLNKNSQEAFINFTQKNNLEYNNSKNINSFKNYQEKKMECLEKAKNRSIFLNSEYRRYKNFDMFKAQLRNSVKIMPLIILVGIILVIAMYNILSVLRNTFELMFGIL